MEVHAPPPLAAEATEANKRQQTTETRKEVRMVVGEPWRSSNKKKTTRQKRRDKARTDFEPKDGKFQKRQVRIMESCSTSATPAKYSIDILFHDRQVPNLTSIPSFFLANLHFFNF